MAEPLTKEEIQERLSAVVGEGQDDDAVKKLVNLAAIAAKSIAEQARGNLVEMRAAFDVAKFSSVGRKAILHGGMFIEYPRIKEVLRTIESCHLDGLITKALDREPDCVFIEGQSNVGKTQVRQHYEETFERRELEEKTVVRVLPIILPQPASPKSVGTELLKKLGDPQAERGSAAILGSRVADLIRTCNVELIVLDELHHFMDSDNNRILRNVSEWIKRLIKETKVPVVALGKPEAKRVLDYDDQLKRLFCRREQLLPFGWDYEQARGNDDFRKFLKAVDLWLPLAEPSILHTWEMALRIHYATDGSVGYVADLLEASMDFAIKERKERLDLPHLARGFNAKIKNVKEHKQNPFSPEVFTPDLALQWIRDERAKKEQAELSKFAGPSSSQLLKARKGGNGSNALKM